MIRPRRGPLKEVSTKSIRAAVEHLRLGLGSLEREESMALFACVLWLESELERRKRR